MARDTFEVGSQLRWSANQVVVEGEDGGGLARSWQDQVGHHSRQCKFPKQSVAMFGYFFVKGKK